jgi:hypothetical protein
MFPIVKSHQGVGLDSRRALGSLPSIQLMGGLTISNAQRPRSNTIRTSGMKPSTRLHSFDCEPAILYKGRDVSSYMAALPSRMKQSSPGTWKI